MERLARGWSQGELAKKSPTVRTLQAVAVAVAGALGVETWTLLVPEERPAPISRTGPAGRVPSGQR